MASNKKAAKKAAKKVAAKTPQKKTEKTAKPVVVAASPAASKKAAPESAVLALSGPELLVVDRVVDQLNGWKVANELHQKQLGEMVLADVFDGNAKAMLEPDKSRLPKYIELRRRLGHECEIDEGELSLLLRVTAFDHLVKGHFWKRLRLGPKQALLPLAAPEAPPSANTSLLDEGAKHAVEFDLDKRGIEAWVRNRLTTLGRKPLKRQPKAKLPTYNRLLDQVDSRFLEKRSLENLVEVVGKLKPEQRSSFAARMRQSARAMLEAADALSNDDE